MEQTKEEEFWNTLTHFIGLILSIIGLPVLLYYNQNLTDFSFQSILFFEFGMICLYYCFYTISLFNQFEIKTKI